MSSKLEHDTIIPRHLSPLFLMPESARSMEGNTSSKAQLTSQLQWCHTTSILALSLEKKPKQMGESTGKKFLVSGIVAWVYEFGAGHFLEFIKIRKQTCPGSYWSLFKEIVAQKGIVGIWDGFFPWGTVQAVAKGAVFGGAHAFAVSQLKPYADDGTISNLTMETVAGGIGGGFQGFALSPTLLLKTRVMTDPVFRERMSVWETTKQSSRVGLKVIRNEGGLALMKGSITFSAKRVADWGTRFYFSALAENYMYKRHDPTYKLNRTEALWTSLVGGTLSSCVTLPMDVMVAQIQQASKAGQKVSVVATFKQQYAKGGWGGLGGFAFGGFIARTVHVAATTVVMRSLTSIVYDIIYK